MISPLPKFGVAGASLLLWFPMRRRRRKKKRTWNGTKEEFIIGKNSSAVLAMQTRKRCLPSPYLNGSMRGQKAKTFPPSLDFPSRKVWTKKRGFASDSRRKVWVSEEHRRILYNMLINRQLSSEKRKRTLIVAFPPFSQP